MMRVARGTRRARKSDRVLLSRTQSAARWPACRAHQGRAAWPDTHTKQSLRCRVSITPEMARNGARAFLYRRERLNSRTGEIKQFRQVAQPFFDCCGREFSERPNTGLTHGRVVGALLIRIGS